MDLKSYAKALSEGRVIHLTKTVNAEMLDSLRRQYDEFSANHPRGELVITLNTGGGSTQYGTALYNEITAYGTLRKVWIVCQGEVGSWGTYLMLAVPAKRRVAMPMAMFFFHLGRFNWKMDLTSIPATHEYVALEYATERAQWKKEQQMLVELLARRTGLGLKKAWRLVKTPTYLTAEEAAAKGIIGHVIKEETED